MEQIPIKSMLFWVINGFVFKLVTLYRDFATQHIPAVYHIRLLQKFNNISE